eukprot:Plantae.Rhodophyta-Hildenbrandia_rubra.ctg9219.p1 GENE.Plantae.Rhodophyta-Hildenbrandia_rubra.ctg9219~~Plantae.Rhodophyta-Hildenbrandia_rubra.ctg9219.p1  ORF type:complete len:766 (+),score=135.39 Plantae.Rhodophyta-Hildenbrandia_rubra.ctg9219:277-2298(+)
MKDFNSEIIPGSNHDRSDSETREWMGPDAHTGKTRKNHVQTPIHKPVVVPPRESCFIDLKVIVDCPGVLTITGVNWRFACAQNPQTPPTDFVPGHAKLVKKRRRLNDTRHQRASEIPLYAPEEGFKVNVRPTAPKLHVSWSLGEQVCMSSGEHRRALLTVENVSPVVEHSSIAALWYQIACPETLFLDADNYEIVRSMKSRTTESKDVSTGNGFSKHGAIVANDASYTGLIKNLALRHGDQLKIPVIIKASIVNSIRHDVLTTGRAVVERQVGILFGYYPTSARFLRIASRIRIAPSLSAFVRLVRPNTMSADKDQKLVLIEVCHDASAGTFKITRISLSSHIGYMLLPVPSSGDARPHFVLKPKGRTLLYALCTRDKDMAKTLLMSVAEPTRSSLALDAAGERNGKLPSDVSRICDSPWQGTLNESLSHPSIGSITLNWRFGTSHGEIPVLPEFDHLSNGPTPKTEVLGDASESQSESPWAVAPRVLDVQVKHVQYLEHNFECGPCIVSVTVCIQNIGSSPMDAVVSVTQNEIADGARGRYWAGDLSVQVKQLCPGAIRHCSLRAIVDTPGTFDLGSLTIGVGKYESWQSSASPVQIVSKSDAVSSEEPHDRANEKLKERMSEMKDHLNGEKQMSNGRKEAKSKSLAKSKVAEVLSKGDDGVWDVADTDEDD